MKWILLSLISIFLIGCGPDLDDPKELDTIIEEALSGDKLQRRGEGDKRLYYEPNNPDPFTGWVKQMSDSGQVTELAQIKDGKPNGLFAEWSSNGQMVSKGEYKDGTLHGDVTRWHENGQKSFEGEAKDGELHGDSTKWYENGQKSVESEWENGKPIKARVWLPNGTDCRDTNLQDGNGIVVVYDDDGEELSRTVFKDGNEVPVIEVSD
jgi:antitoxin component YwqK of YwqJK toxin-antitoxin module